MGTRKVEGEDDVDEVDQHQHRQAEGEELLAREQAVGRGVEGGVGHQWPPFFAIIALRTWLESWSNTTMVRNSRMKIAAASSKRPCPQAMALRRTKPRMAEARMLISKRSSA